MAPPTTPSASQPQQPGKWRLSFKKVLLLAVVAIVVAVIISTATSSSPKLSIKWDPYPASSKVVDVNILITNDGNAPVTPTCNISLFSNNMTSNGVDIVSLKSPIAPHKTASITDPVIMTNNDAANVSKAKSSVKC